MAPITDIPTYLRAHARELGDRILQSYPPLCAIDDPPSPTINRLLRKPYPAQTLAIVGQVRRWQQARAGAVIAECGTGKTLISLGAVYTHADIALDNLEHRVGRCIRKLRGKVLASFLDVAQLG